MVGIKGLGCTWATVEVKGWANDSCDVALAGIWSGLVLEHLLNKIGCNSKGDPGTVTVATRNCAEKVDPRRASCLSSVDCPPKCQNMGASQDQATVQVSLLAPEVLAPKVSFMSSGD